MKFNFKINNQDIEILVSDSEQFRKEFLIQKGYFGQGHDITQEEIERCASLDLVFLMEQIVLNLDPTKDITVIDIGAGNSVTDLVLAKIFDSAKFILLDGDEWIGCEEIHSADFKPYNYWKHVKIAIRLNGFDHKRFLYVGLDYAFDQPADLITSCGAWGLHFPIETYLDSALKALKPGGILALAPILNINNALEKVNAHLTPLMIHEIKTVDRNAKDWPRFSKYFPINFSGPWGYVGIWRRD